ncbi:MAG: hypothetical protein J6S40_10050 [Thermoguttaceae bacterium]|nr:hypothetical protein [Thermoguttaceae bacterium]
MTTSVFKACAEQGSARGTRAARFLAAALCLFLLLAAGCTSKIVTLTEVKNPPQLRPQKVDAFHTNIHTSPAATHEVRRILREHYVIARSRGLPPARNADGDAPPFGAVAPRSFPSVSGRPGAGYLSIFPVK